MGTYLFLARAEHIPLGLHQSRCLGYLNVLQIAGALALGVELEERVCGTLDLSLILDCAKAVAEAPRFLRFGVGRG